MPYTNVCITCGNVFETERGYRDRCDDCTVKIGKRCQICGCKLEAHESTKRLCADCRSFSKNEHSKEREKEYRQIRKVAASAEKRRQKREARGGIGIVEAVKAAEMLGMSYGEYMSKYR